MSDKNKSRKQIILRLNQDLWEELTRWADDDFRSLNGQVEYLLTNAVREQRKKNFDEED